MKDSKRISKETRKGAAGLAIAVQMFLENEGDTLGKKAFKTKLYAIVNKYTTDEQKAAYQILLKDSDIKNHARAKIIAKALSSNEDKTSDDEDLKDTVHKMADQAAENLRDSEDCNDTNDDADFGAVRLVRKPAPTEPVKKESMLSRAAYKITTGKRNMSINLLTASALTGRKLGRIFAHS